MAVYKYTATDENGEVVKGTINAKTYEEFERALEEKKLFLMESEVEREAFKSKTISFGKASGKLTIKEVVFFCKQVSTMLYAGLPLARCFSILVSVADKPLAKQVYGDILERIQKGESLSSAMDAQKGAFPSMLISMIEAGEASGKLDEIVGRMCTHYEKEMKTNRKIKSAMTYPVTLIVLSVLVVLVIFTFVLPTFMSMFEGMELPWTTALLMKISEFIISYWYIGVGGVVAIVVAIKVAMKVPAFQVWVDMQKICLPYFGKLVKKILTSRFGRTLSLLYASGISIVDCLSITIKVLDNKYLSIVFEKVLLDVTQGQPLSSSLEQTKLFDNMFNSIIILGEETGKIDKILNDVSGYYEEEADRAIEGLMAVITPAILVILAGIIGFIMISVMTPMYSMYQAV